MDRKGSLRDALAAHAADDASFEDALDRLEDCERRLRSETPFAFYAWLLGGDGGRARILQRLGHEANDALDEFLELALSYEKQGAGLAAGFHGLAARRRHRGQARHGDLARRGARDDRARRQGAGSAGGVPGRHHDVAVGHRSACSLIHLPQGNARQGRGLGRHARPTIRRRVADARSAMLEETEDEYRRLLYVAMTRAADRLIVGGCMPGNRNSVRENSWYDLISDGLAQFRT